MSIATDLKRENGQMRGLTGSGRPGLHTLLGGTGEELDAGGLTLTGGSAQVSGTSKLAQAYRDTRLAAVAAGRTEPGGRGPSTGEPLPRHEAK